jgi:hypothetical protein
VTMYIYTGRYLGIGSMQSMKETVNLRMKTKRCTAFMTLVPIPYNAYFNFIILLDICLENMVSIGQVIYFYHLIIAIRKFPSLIATSYV